MNRVIKFRGRRVDNGEWVSGDLFQSFCEDKAFINPTNCLNMDEYDFREVDKETIGQFTGKKDDGEDDLYDGDIIQFDWGFKSCIGVIYWCEKELAFMVENKTIDGYVVYLAEVDNAVTKIGNIHDNPELLNEVGV